MSDDLINFLRGRLDEDEAAARASARTERADTWTTLPDSYGGVLDGTGSRSLAIGYGDVMAPETAVHIARHDPTRALRQVETTRGILARIQNHAAIMGQDEIHRDVLRLLALPYADHPDYREEWRP